VSVWKRLVGNRKRMRWTQRNIDRDFLFFRNSHNARIKFTAQFTHIFLFQRSLQAFQFVCVTSFIFHKAVHFEFIHFLTEQEPQIQITTNHNNNNLDFWKLKSYIKCFRHEHRLSFINNRGRNLKTHLFIYAAE